MAESVRELAYTVLKNSEKHKTYSNIAIDRALCGSSLSDADRGLLTALVMGVAERRITLDYIIDLLSRDKNSIESETRVLLRMGIYQIIFLDRIPDHAAVNETVELAPRRIRGYVNAVLRSLLRILDKEGYESLFDGIDEGTDRYLSVKYSFPEDFCRLFAEIYGRERAENIFEIFNSPPSMTLRINTLKISRDDYAALLDERGISYILSSTLENAIILRNVSFSALPGFDEGCFFIQDEASQICVEALGARPCELVIDTCSCPGSKSFGSAIRMNNCGRIYSFDLHESKLGLVRSSAERLGIDIIKTEKRDGRDSDEGLFGKADRVLCDVPCSGLGVIAKKPEIRYKALSDIKKLPEIQYSILDSSSEYLKRGGILVYSTCTVLSAENEDVVERFLSSHAEFEPVEFRVGDKESRGGMLKLSPDKDKTDGFFVAKMKRKD